MKDGVSSLLCIYICKGKRNLVKHGKNDNLNVSFMNHLRFFSD